MAFLLNGQSKSAQLAADEAQEMRICRKAKIYSEQKPCWGYRDIG